jgi:hypothetical protein
MLFGALEIFLKHQHNSQQSQKSGVDKRKDACYNVRATKQSVCPLSPPDSVPGRSIRFSRVFGGIGWFVIAGRSSVRIFVF